MIPRAVPAIETVVANRNSQEIVSPLTCTGVWASPRLPVPSSPYGCPSGALRQIRSSGVSPKHVIAQLLAVDEATEVRVDVRTRGGEREVLIARGEPRDEQRDRVLGGGAPPVTVGIEQ